MPRRQVTRRTQLTTSPSQVARQVSQRSAIRITASCAMSSARGSRRARRWMWG